MAQSPYRPHDPGHNYYAPGIYLITLSVRALQGIRLSHLNDSAANPAALMTEIGKAVQDCWQQIPEIQARHDRHIAVHRAVCMPDHFHGVIEVLQPMDVSVGEVIRSFKTGCTGAYYALLSAATATTPAAAATSPAATTPTTASSTAGSATAGSAAATAAPAASGLPHRPLVQPNLAEQEMLRHMSRRQRADFYDQRPWMAQPLWDDNYDDTICLTDPATGGYDQRHLEAMVRYVDDNPRRAILRRLHPEFMQRCLHLVIGGRDYAAFGNLFLLRWARKVQVFCHRKARYGQLTDDERQRHGYGQGSYVPDFETGVPYETTEAFHRQCREWKRLLMEGQTVMVTPGISMGERLIKNRCLESGYPLIHIQREPIGSRWKPEHVRFEACVGGSLLILAPWQPEQMGDVNGVPTDTDYAVFHNLNRITEEICAFTGDARIIGLDQ